jgi:predicted RNA methylase
MEPLSEYDPHRGSYRDVVTHKLMLQDVVRTAGYLEGLRHAVKPGARVIDFGAGTGVLSIFAQRFGAGTVDAIERTSIVEQAKVERVSRDSLSPHRSRIIRDRRSR